MTKLYYVLLFLLFVCGCTNGAPELSTKKLHEFYPGAISNVDSVVITSGSNERQMLFINKQQVEEWINRIKDIELVPDSNQEPRTGYDYAVSLREGKENKLTFTTTFMDGGYYFHNDSLEKSIKDFIETADYTANEHSNARWDYKEGFVIAKENGRVLVVRDNVDIGKSTNEILDVVKPNAIWLTVGKDDYHSVKVGDQISIEIPNGEINDSYPAQAGAHLKVLHKQTMFGTLIALSSACDKPPVTVNWTGSVYELKETNTKAEPGMKYGFVSCETGHFKVGDDGPGTLVVYSHGDPRTNKDLIFIGKWGAALYSQKPDSYWDFKMGFVIAKEESRILIVRDSFNLEAPLEQILTDAEPNALWLGVDKTEFDSVSVGDKVSIEIQGGAINSSYPGQAEGHAKIIEKQALQKMSKSAAQNGPRLSKIT